MNDIVTKDNINIEDMIYEIRGKQVMLDSDLAKLYEVETKQLNRQVKRNIERFDEDFMFQLTNLEYQNLKCQIGTSSLTNYGGRRTLPYVFTEMGVATLSSILHSDIAISMSKKIIRAFVKMRHFINDNLIEQKYINKMVLDHDNKINELFDKFDKKDNHLFLENTTFDSYVDILNILSLAKKEIIIIDNYADINTLNLIKKLNIKVTIICNNKKYLTEEDLNKYNQEYNNLKVIFNNSFHDRYIIIDKKDIYFLGSSINNIGNKISSIIKCNDKEISNMLLNMLNESIIKK